MCGHQQIDCLAAILCNQCRVCTRPCPCDEGGMGCASCALIEIVRGAERVQVCCFDFHRRFGNLDLKTCGLGLLLEVRVRDTARRGIRDHIIEGGAGNTKLRTDQDQDCEGHESGSIK